MHPLLPIDETRYLAVAWEMHLSGDYFHLTRNFALYAHKPPLLFWLINLVWAVTGGSDLAGRLVGPAFATACIPAVAASARRFWPDDDVVALRAALILAGFTAFALYGGATMFDSILALAVLWGVSVLWQIGQGVSGARQWLAFGGVLALGAYAKGPVILIHLAPIALSMRFWAPDPPRPAVMARGLLLALALALALLGLWLVPALLKGSDAYRHELLWTQSAGRVAGGLAHDRPIWFFISLLPVLLFPWGWSIGLWKGAVRAVRTEAPARMAAIWALSGLVLFSVIASKQAHYLVPELPAMALLFARATRVAPLDRELRPGGLLVAVPLVILALSGFLAAAGILKINLAAYAGQATSISVFAGFCLLLAGLAWRGRGVLQQTLVGLGLSVAILGVAGAAGVMRNYDQTAIAALLHRASPQGIALTGMTYNAEFNYAARLQAPIATPDTAAGLALWAAAHPGGTILAPRAAVAFTAPPNAAFRYNGEDFGVWPVAAVLTELGG